MRRLCVLVSVMSALAGIGVSPEALADGGRWKVGESGCYWDPNDGGPDQCSPGTGRYKVGDGPVCYWDANDSGPNQCEPGQQTPAETIPEDQPIPYLDDSASVQRSFASETPTAVTCASFAPVAENGAVRFSVRVASDGTVVYSMGMPHFWENYGLWIVTVKVNDQLQQGHVTATPPSGSLPPTVARPGSKVNIEAHHWFVYFEIYWLPTPECGPYHWCFRPMPVPLPARTHSKATCWVS